MNDVGRGPMPSGDMRVSPPAEPNARARRPAGLRALPILITVAALVAAGLLGWAVWDAYLVAPWTRDGTVRAYVVSEASEVSGRLVKLSVHADSFVHKGELLMEIDPTNYVIAVASATANLAQARANLEDKRLNAERREKLTTLSTSLEEKQDYATMAQTAAATVQQQTAQLAQARVNLERTRIISPVNGYVTNLTAQQGDYVNVGERIISVVNADSYWVDGYFEETQLAGIRIGDRARILLMGYKTPLRGHVGGISRGIEVSNAQPDAAGLASVNPVFTWIRLAQRIPVRIAIDQVPAAVTLVAGMTATIQIEPNTAKPGAPPLQGPGSSAAR